MKKFLSASLPALNLCALFAVAGAQSRSLDGTWQFAVDREGKLTINDLSSVKDLREIRAPLSWNVQFADLRDYSGVAWYRKTVDLHPIKRGHHDVSPGRRFRQGRIRATPARRADQDCGRRRVRAEADDRIICSPTKRSYTARVSTLRPTRRPTRHMGAYSINLNYMTCEGKYDYAFAAAAIGRDSPGYA
jgi:hypothetical protein